MQDILLYGLLWIFYIAVGLVFLNSLGRLLHFIGWAWLRELLLVTLAVVLLAPATVPGYDGYYAPATLVIFFEVYFRQSGYPASALFLMQVSCVVGWLVVLVKHWRS